MIRRFTLMSYFGHKGSRRKGSLGRLVGRRWRRHCLRLLLLSRLSPRRTRGIRFVLFIIRIVFPTVAMFVVSRFRLRARVLVAMLLGRRVAVLLIFYGNGRRLLLLIVPLFVTVDPLFLLFQLFLLPRREEVGGR